MPKRLTPAAVLSAVAVVFALTGSLLLRPSAGTAAPRSGAGSAVAADVPSTGKRELPMAKAVVLGLVEGVTEFLPISSTGHLLVAERLMDLGTESDDAKNAIDAYTVIIQLGAILAVLLISWRRVLDVLQGLIGRSTTGRRLLIALICAFVPAAVAGVALNDTIDAHLLKPTPVALAWIVGGIAIMFVARRYRAASGSGRALDTITPRDAVVIGVAQALALWPGTSRSLVTIVAAVLLGFSLGAAVEFSFLLGLCTLAAACFYSLAKDGSLVFDHFGATAPLVGIAVAFVSAAVAVRWMVTYLQRHDLNVFAVYRIVAGIVTLGFVITKVI